MKICPPWVDVLHHLIREGKFILAIGAAGWALIATIIDGATFGVLVGLVLYGRQAELTSGRRGDINPKRKMATTPSQETRG